MHEHYVYQWTTSLQVFALDAAFWKGSRRIKAVTKQDYSLLLGSNSNDNDDDFVLPPVFAGKGKSAQKRACSPNDVRLDRIESRQVELEDRLKRFKRNEDSLLQNVEIRKVSNQLQLCKTQFDSLNGVIMSMKSNIECLICTNGIEDESAVFACC